MRLRVSVGWKHKHTSISEVVILHLGTQVGVLEVLILDFCESNHFGDVFMNQWYAMLWQAKNASCANRINEEPIYQKVAIDRKLSGCGGGTETPKMRFPGLVFGTNGRRRGRRREKMNPCLEDSLRGREAI